MWELGIVAVSQRPAIFWQHSRCSILISAAGVRHANSGSVETMIANTTDTNWDTLRNISIVPRPANFMWQMTLDLKYLLRAACPVLKQAAPQSVLPFGYGCTTSFIFCSAWPGPHGTMHWTQYSPGLLGAVSVYSSVPGFSLRFQPSLANSLTVKL